MFTDKLETTSPNNINELPHEKIQKLYTQSLKSNFQPSFKDDKQLTEKIINEKIKELISEPNFQNEFEKSLNSGTSFLLKENVLEQMEIEELEKLLVDLKLSVEKKKDALFNQLQIKNRLSDRLVKIFELIEKDFDFINKMLDKEKNSISFSTEVLNECVANWNEEKDKIKKKFEKINSLLNQLV